MLGGRRGSYMGPRVRAFEVCMCMCVSRYMGECPANFHTHLRAGK